jgi:hypothetical protein
VLEAIRAGSTRKAAALHAGVDQHTLDRWIAGFVHFAEAIARAEADAQLRMEAIVMQAAPTDWHAASWWLERRRPDDYSQHQKVDLEVYVRRRARELGLDEDEAFESPPLCPGCQNEAEWPL